MSPLDSSSAFGACLEGINQKWIALNHSPHQNLLKWALLRETSRSLHAEKSRSLADPKGNGATFPHQAFVKIQARLLQIIPEDLTHPSLTEMLLSPAPVAKALPLAHPLKELPPELFAQIPRDRLDRYDRRWECQLALWGIKMGFVFRALINTVPLLLAERFHRELEAALWPQGVILFVESAEDLTKHTESNTQNWRGRWVLLTAPEFKSETAKLPPLAKDHEWHRLYPSQS